MREVLTRAETLMGTVVSIEVVGHADDADAWAARAAAVDRAFERFRQVEAACSRFAPTSELVRLAARPGEAVPVSDELFTAVRYALDVAKSTGGAFDPTVGHAMEQLGFNREHRTGRTVQTELGPDAEAPVTFQDVELNDARRTIRLDRRLLLDLGAVAKGLAVDLAVGELRPFGDFAVDAGGDLYLGGVGPSGAPWRIGIRHPREADRLIETLVVSDAAVCTSGDYARRTGSGGVHHVLDARTKRSVSDVASVTVVAPTAMEADALATAAFVLGPVQGIALLERRGVEGLLVSTSIACLATKGMSRYAAVLSNA